MRTTNQKGFTLLEIIVVIIIIGVLASLALPRLFQQVGASRGVEALNTFKEIKAGMERCALGQTNNAYTNCNGATAAATFNNLGMADPATDPNSSFNYVFQNVTATRYEVIANQIGGTADDRIMLRYNRTGAEATDENCVDGDDQGAFRSTLQGDCDVVANRI